MLVHIETGLCTGNTRRQTSRLPISCTLVLGGVCQGHAIIINKDINNMLVAILGYYV